MSILMLDSAFPQLIYQQFINCAYLEILPFYASLVFVVPVPCACTGYLYVPYSGHVIGTGQTETMEVSDSLTILVEDFVTSLTSTSSLALIPWVASLGEISGFFS